jgi:hypothetical protein
MTVLFAGGENSEVDILNGSTVADGGQSYRAAYARCAVRSAADNGVLHTYTGELAAYLAGQGTSVDYWYGFQYRGAGGSTSQATCVTFFTASYRPFLQVGNYNGAIGTADIRTSPDGFTSTVNSYPSSVIAQPGTGPGGGTAEWTFRIKRGVSGTFEWWINGALWYAITGDNTGLFTTALRTSWGLGGSNAINGISEIIATSADDARVGMNCFTAYYTANGTNTGWTGSYTDINEMAEDTATVLKAASAGLDSDFTHVTVPALSPGQVIRAVVPSGKWRTAGGAPQHLYPYLNIGGTIYANAPLPSAMQTVAAVAGLLQGIWELSPATGLAFTVTEVNNTKPGMRSAA